jgi:hypothetical protein
MKGMLIRVRPAKNNPKGINNMLGLPLKPVCNELKRIGYIRDRECPIEVRVGDTLILYISTALA